MTGLVTGSANLIGSQLVAPPGTRMMFHQASPPLGWVTDATLTDHAVQIVTGAGGGATAGTAHSSLLGAGTFNLNAVTLAAGNIPSHAHTVFINHAHGIAVSAFTTAGGAALDNTENNMFATNTGGAGTGITLNNNGSGTSFTPTITSFSLKYAAFIVAQKS